MWRGSGACLVEGKRDEEWGLGGTRLVGYVRGKFTCGNEKESRQLFCAHQECVVRDSEIVHGGSEKEVVEEVHEMTAV